MGEIAEMMIYGEMCPCGEYLGNGAGYQRFCSPQCEEDFGGGASVDGPETTPRTLKRDKVPCPICGKKVAPVGLRQHLSDRHGPAVAVLRERDELRRQVEELEAERDEAIDDVVKEGAEVLELREALEWALDRLDTLTRNDAMDAETYKRYAEARALLGEGAADAD